MCEESFDSQACSEKSCRYEGDEGEVEDEEEVDDEDNKDDKSNFLTYLVINSIK